MYRMKLHLVLAILLMTTANAFADWSVNANDVIDMTYPYSESTPFWPGNDNFTFTIGTRGPSGNLSWYEGNSFCTPEHGGTHIDSPSHFFKGKWRLHEIPAHRLMGPAVKVDISAKVATNKDALLEVTDLENWVKANGEIPANCILFVYTSWGQYYNNRTAYLGTNSYVSFKNDAGESILHFPGISKEAATWIVNTKKIMGVGIDTASVDHGPSVTFDVHVTLFSANIYGIENVAYLDRLPTKGAVVYALPIKVLEGSGGPARIIAIKNMNVSGNPTSGSAEMLAFRFLVVIFVILGVSMRLA